MLSLDSEKIKSLLPEEYTGTEIIVFNVIDSTNSEAKRVFVKDGKDMLIVAGKQTAGRGRHGKSFYSPEETGIYMSLVVHADLPLNHAARATTAAAVAVCKAIEKLTDKKPEIKWVNDIFINNKKVCGILTEAVSTAGSRTADALIIGIGINVYTSDFPDEIKDIAGSLNENGLDKNSLIAEICKGVFGYAADLFSDGFIEEYRKRCFVIGKEISYERNGERFFATAVDIDENGGLIIKNTDGEISTLQSGEISIKMT
ncbi:MAG: biotin--[acetyl-CoA-carboxylase] ligase [Clostridia bacterium]|nr:biotin--[acetyl-CoA-carboxylase] ligase [Clostridia bacterium]